MVEQNLSLAEKVKKTSARWNPLRKVDTLGQFDFNTCIVMLDSLETKSVKDITLADLKSEEKFDVVTYSRLTKALALAVHEYTHFVDSTSTLWGLRHLRMLHRSFTCDMTDESKFHVMRTCYTHLKRIKLPDYYTTVTKEFDTARPWQWKATSGREFRYDGKPGERPIFFVRFFNENWEPIVRSPISTVSLLETSAMAAELRATASLIRRIQDDGERAVQTKIFENETMAYLYNENLTEYSVCAHLVANRFNASEASLTFWASAIIARVVLNSSQDVYKAVLKNIKIFFDIVGLRNGQPEAKAIRRGLENCDPGVLFYVLCLRMDRNALDSVADFAMTLVATLMRFGVHYNKDYVTTALAEAENIMEEVRSSRFKTIVDMAAAGFENLINTVSQYGMMDLHKMNLPPVLLGDSTLHNFHDVEHNCLNNFNVEDSYFEMLDGQLQMESFGDACI
ncbi:hypothetical protein HTX81_26785 [Pseudomonas lini]|uniref:hypothetical protein n=1 Tax=Pseudomonas lini TaxID=163011 RepID=UPI0005792ECC|nr:hypothetical protein [Pseudomonas lini]NSX12208.1 hypothetical protein [Pseudomonas lini]